ncbi:MAG: helix-turn-helix domain-containing protein [Candidatus Hydrogenedentes bacterium]|nr:helix-turn-helix domain-containing protein [Candidatus Hydrogenedentota bacterium]
MTKDSKPRVYPDLGRRIGIILRAYRLHLGWTQQVLARKAKVSQSAVSHMEKGKRSQLLALERMSVALGKSLSETIQRAENVMEPKAVKRELKKRIKARKGKALQKA